MDVLLQQKTCHTDTHLQQVVDEQTPPQNGNVSTYSCQSHTPHTAQSQQLASCLIYARALLEYVFFILRVRSVSKMLPSVKFAEDKVLTFLILRANAKKVQIWL